MSSTGYYGSLIIEALVVGGILAALMSMAIVVYRYDTRYETV